MLKIPPEGHPVRALIDVDAVAALTVDDIALLPTVPEARALARQAWVNQPCVRGPQYGEIRYVLVRSEHGRVMLIGCNSRGGYKVRWTFRRADSVPDYLEVPEVYTRLATILIDEVIRQDPSFLEGRKRKGT